MSSSFQVMIAFGILLAFLVTLSYNTYSITADGAYYPNNWRYILGNSYDLSVNFIGQNKSKMRHPFFPYKNYISDSSKSIRFPPK